jgi:hypothetical protein
MARKLSVLAMVLLLAGCGSVGLGDLGGLGDILGSTGSNDASDIRGTISRIDTSNQAIILDVSYINNLRDDRQGSTVYYDSNTVVEYQGNRYAVTDLERGDEVSITGRNSGGRYVADRIVVTRNVRG